MACSNAARTLSSSTLPLESFRILVASATVLSVFEALTASALPLTSFTVLEYAAAKPSSSFDTALMSVRLPDGHPGTAVFDSEAAFTLETSTATVFASFTSSVFTETAAFRASDSR